MAGAADIDVGRLEAGRDVVGRAVEDDVAEPEILYPVFQPGPVAGLTRELAADDDDVHAALGAPAQQARRLDQGVEAFRRVDVADGDQLQAIQTCDLWLGRDAVRVEPGAIDRRLDLEAGLGGERRRGEVGPAHRFAGDDKAVGEKAREQAEDEAHVARHMGVVLVPDHRRADQLGGNHPFPLPAAVAVDDVEAMAADHGGEGGDLERQAGEIAREVGQVAGQAVHA